MMGEINGIVAQYLLNILLVYLLLIHLINTNMI